MTTPSKDRASRMGSDPIVAQITRKLYGDEAPSDFETAIMTEIRTRRERYGDYHDNETYIAGLMRAIVVTSGRDRAETLFAAYGESY
jgi:hypothetical protein